MKSQLLQWTCFAVPTFRDRALWAVVCASVLSSPSAEAQVTIDPEELISGQPSRTVSVVAMGETQAQPDLAIFLLGVRTEGATAEEALRRNSERMSKLVSTLTGMGISSDDIQTQSIRMQPRFTNHVSPEARKAERPGYVAMNTVEVRTRNLDHLGKLLDAAVAAGGNTIEDLHFEISDTSKLLDQARANAMAAARHKAEHLAKLAEAQLGPVLNINEVSRTPRPMPLERYATAERTEVPIEPGSQTVRVEVQVTWMMR